MVFIDLRWLDWCMLGTCNTKGHYCSLHSEKIEVTKISLILEVLKLKYIKTNRLLKLRNSNSKNQSSLHYVDSLLNFFHVLPWNLQDIFFKPVKYYEFYRLQ